MSFNFLIKALDILKKANAISEEIADESAPYDKLYASSDLLKKFAEEIEHDIKDKESQLDNKVGCTPLTYGDLYSYSVLVTKIRAATMLLETDLLAEGESLMSVPLKDLESFYDRLRHFLEGPEGEKVAPSKGLILDLLTESTAALLIRAYNSFGALTVQRAQFTAATSWLDKAEGLYEERQVNSLERSSSQGTLEQGSPDHEEIKNVEAALEAAFGGGAAAAEVESHRTTTLFYLAQVHGHAGDKAASAKYCAATLCRQLEGSVFGGGKGTAGGATFQLDDWIQNCLQLAGYYVTVGAYALGQRCIDASRAVAAKAANAATKAATDFSPPTREDPKGTSVALADDVTANLDLAQAKSYLSRLELSLMCFERGEEWETAKRRAVDHLDTDGKALSVVSAPEEGSVNGCAPWLYSSSDDLPEQLRFPSLGLPHHDNLPWYKAPGADASSSSSERSASANQAGELENTSPSVDLETQNIFTSVAPVSALARRFEDARDLFNAALPLYKKAVEHYKLDGWVTEHVNVLMEMSNLYRSLAGFEPSPARRAAMHIQRTKLLTPLSGQLSTVHYEGASRSIDLELANAYRDAMTERENQVEAVEAEAGGKPLAASGLKAVAQANRQASEAARQATKHYLLFLKTYCDAAGQLPTVERVPEESERHVLAAAFNVGRIVRKSTPPPVGKPGDMESLRRAQEEADEDLNRALRMLAWAADYADRHHVAAFSREAALSREMAALMVEQRRRLQQVRSRGLPMP